MVVGSAEILTFLGGVLPGLDTVTLHDTDPARAAASADRVAVRCPGLKIATAYSR